MVELFKMDLTENQLKQLNTEYIILNEIYKNLRLGKENTGEFPSYESIEKNMPVLINYESHLLIDTVKESYNFISENYENEFKIPFVPGELDLSDDLNLISQSIENPIILNRKEKIKKVIENDDVKLTIVKNTITKEWFLRIDYNVDMDKKRSIIINNVISYFKRYYVVVIPVIFGIVLLVLFNIDTFHKFTQNTDYVNSSIQKEKEEVFAGKKDIVKEEYVEFDEVSIPIDWEFESGVYDSNQVELVNLAVEKWNLISSLVRDDFYTNGWNLVFVSDVAETVGYEKENCDVIGFTDSSNKVVYVEFSENGINNALVHEIGHYFEYENYDKVFSEKFSEIYLKEVDGFVEHGTERTTAKSNIEEYFAESFAQYMMYGEEFYNNCPSTYAYIFNLLH